MSHPAAPKSLEDLQAFEFTRILNEDPLTHTLTLLGSLRTEQAIIRIEKTPLNASDASKFLRPGDGGLVRRIQLEESTDIYTWLFGWLEGERVPDVKINVICPATETHIRKYTRQEQVMVRETPELYESVVKPYVAEFPPSRTQWVENILNGQSEKDKVLYSDGEFMILPDMKWDLKTVSSLYLMALVKDRSIRSMRDLQSKHVPLLKAIRDQAERIVQESYSKALSSHLFADHFHVHIVNVNYQGGLLGMTVGQAHLVDDLINQLELDGTLLQRRTLYYSLGDQHELLRRFKAAQQAPSS
ncbi:mRNA decapping enzyme [Coprinopsis cinerea okayama7|uniref:mRNA decapping enzyme n=1 Tax=Coprinopsis cinerea (strain Okayama-7 / 130 / ATCC MYA-4618 / FGSC 9003) TaxID=240176 RepID=A8NQB9_COPC7|nr:mRNA decapping enzyme [Coprinopsis cinerea okayama7\|eukprot:XP_001835522.2 mRNA decapping enzyme [Coprinopsis cinerea okayama7\